MKKGGAAAAAELRIAETGWLPEVLRNRKAMDKGSPNRRAVYWAEPTDERPSDATGE